MSTIGDFFKSMFSKFVRAFKSFMSEALPVGRQFVMGQLQQIATKTVEELARTDLNNSQRREEAFKRIKDYAIQNSISGARDSLINALIELAVLKFKKEF